jgi:cysteine desulfurase/selenocysteine lyase
MSGVTAVSRPAAAFDVRRIRRDFPILQESVHGKPLVYLDNAATAQKPQAVIDTMVRSLAEENANIHRGVHALSERATRSFEDARTKVTRFINAADVHEIVFVRGTTEAINLVAQTFGRTRMTAGDEVLISALEHHSNIVPWQLLAEQIGIHIRVIPMTDAGELRLDQYRGLLTPRTKLVSVVHVSNSLGTINPVQEIVSVAHERRIPVLLDGAQAVPHLKVDVRRSTATFMPFPDTRCSGQPASGCSTESAICSKACLRIRAAAT